MQIISVLAIFITHQVLIIGGTVEYAKYLINMKYIDTKNKIIRNVLFIKPIIFCINILNITGTYFNCIMFMVASSVVSTIMILNYHHRLASNGTMPVMVRKVFLQWLPWLLRMSRNGEKITRKSIELQDKVFIVHSPNNTDSG